MKILRNYIFISSQYIGKVSFKKKFIVLFCCKTKLKTQKKKKKLICFPHFKIFHTFSSNFPLIRQIYFFFVTFIHSFFFNLFFFSFEKFILYLVPEFIPLLLPFFLHKKSDFVLTDTLIRCLSDNRYISESLLRFTNKYP